MSYSVYISQVKAAHEEQAPGHNREHGLNTGERVVHQHPPGGGVGTALVRTTYSTPYSNCSGEDHSLSSVGSHFSSETRSSCIIGELEATVMEDTELNRVFIEDSSLQ